MGLLESEPFMFDVLNDNAGALQAVFAFFVALSTIAYVVLTRSLVRETAKLRKAETDPKVVVYLDIPEFTRLLNVVVVNIGQGPAYDVSFQFSRDVQDIDGNVLAEVGFFRGIPFFPPNQTMQTILGTTLQLMGKTKLEPVTATVMYRSSDHTWFSEPFVLSTAIYDNLMVTGEAPVKVLTDALGKTTDAINKVATTLGKR